MRLNRLVGIPKRARAGVTPARMVPPRGRGARARTTAGLTAALVLGVSVVASAAELWGGPLSARTASQASTAFLRCGIVNLGDNAITVTIEIFDFNGVSLTDPVPLPPIGARAVTALSIPSSPTVFPSTCKFSGSFSKNRVRATAEVFVPDQNGAVAVVEAR